MAQDPSLESKSGGLNDSRPNYDWLPSFEAMTEEELKLFRYKIGYTTSLFPAAALAGGAALRVWLDQRDMAVPREISGDIDMAVGGNDQPMPDFYRLKSDRGPVEVDVFWTARPIEIPFYTSTSYQGEMFNMTTLPFMFHHKFFDFRADFDTGERIEKDQLYLAIFSSVANEAELTTYLDTIAGIPELNYCSSRGFDAFLQEKGLYRPTIS